MKDKGWEDQPKLLLQVLWERGFIDDTQKVQQYYTITGSKYWYGNLIPCTILQTLMEACYDFVNEKILLQEIMLQRGITVHRLPKCHSELAGEGIEYSWGYAKNRYQRLALKLKRKKEFFRESVRNTMSKDVQTKIMVRRFAWQAKAYTCAYYSFEHGDNEKNTGEKISPNIIEKMVTEFKTHRFTLDFDGKFIKTESQAGYVRAKKILNPTR